MIKRRRKWKSWITQESESDVDLPDNPRQLSTGHHRHSCHPYLSCLWSKPQCWQVKSFESWQFWSSNAVKSREKIYAWIIELSSPETREAALLELSKKREVAVQTTVFMNMQMIPLKDNERSLKFKLSRLCLTSPLCYGTPSAQWLLSSKRSSTSIQPSILRLLSLSSSMIWKAHLLTWNISNHQHPLYQPIRRCWLLIRATECVMLWPCFSVSPLILTPGQSSTSLLVLTLFLPGAA